MFVPQKKSFLKWSSTMLILLATIKFVNRYAFFIWIFQKIRLGTLLGQPLNYMYFRLILWEKAEHRQKWTEDQILRDPGHQEIQSWIQLWFQVIFLIFNVKIQVLYPLLFQKMVGVYSYRVIHSLCPVDFFSFRVAWNLDFDFISD